jgi:hypothetical protein
LADPGFYADMGVVVGRGTGRRAIDCQGDWVEQRPEESANAVPSSGSPLAYARPMSATTPPAPAPLGVVLNCLPGLICWLVLLSMLLRKITFTRLWWPARLFESPLGVVFVLCCWGVAVITAIGSLFRYGPRRPKPWYVWLNLVINITGLLFTAGIVFLVVVAMVH